MLNSNLQILYSNFQRMMRFENMVMKVISTGSGPGNCYSLQTESGEALLLDCGCDYKKILRGIGYQISRVAGCLLTHEHGDHSRAYDKITLSGVTVYTNNEAAEKFSGEWVIGLPEKKTVQIGDFKVVPFYVEHDGTPNYAFLIRHPECGTLLYATDFMKFDCTFKTFGINHFLIECNHLDGFSKEVPQEEYKHSGHSIRGHSSLSTVKDIIRLNKTNSLKTITLCHLSDSWADPEIMQKEIQAVVGNAILVQIARPGLEVDLSLCPF